MSTSARSVPRPWPLAVARWGLHCARFAVMPPCILQPQRGLPPRFRLTLRLKLLLSQVPFFLALLLLSILHRWSVSSVGGAAQNILRENYRSVLSAQRMEDALLRLDSAALFVLGGKRDRGLQQRDEHQQRFERELRIAEGNITEPGEREAVLALRRRWQDYQPILLDLFAAVAIEEARALYFGRAEPAFVGVKAAADAILTLNQDAMVHKSDHARRVAEQVSQIATLSSLAAILLGILLSLLLTARLLRPLFDLRDAARRLGAGELGARAAVRGHDEIAHLASDFNAMAQQIQRYRQSSLGELLAAQQAAQSAIDSLADPVVVFDGSGRVANLNREAEALWPVSSERDARELPPSIEPAVAEVLSRLRAHILLGKGAYAPKDFSEAVQVGRGESERWLLPRASPVYGAAGAVEGATIVLQDITRLRRFDELKNDLVATVAHEFRTPLTSLRMAVHLCLEGIAGPVTEKQIELLHAAREDCERLQGMIEDLLDLARIASGRVEMRKVLVSVQNLIDGVVAEGQAKAQEKGVLLCAEHSPLSPQKIFADPERLGLVFSNLVSNAIRHTPVGGRVTVRALPAGESARFEVSDTGEGIPLPYQREIFLRFFRVPGSPAGGAGLGLSIAKEIVEAHGGRISVHSQPGQGSTFSVQVPLLDSRKAEPGRA